VDFYGKAYSASSVDFTVSIYPMSGGLPDMSGAPLASADVDLGSTADWHTASFTSPPFLQSGVQYVVSFYSNTTDFNATNYICENNDGTDYYASGSGFYSDDSGATWTEGAADDYAFRTYMVPESRVYLSDSNTDSVYTAVHDPTADDFELALGDRDTLNAVAGAASSNPVVGFDPYGDPVSNMNSADETYWRCVQWNFTDNGATDPQEIWATFDFDIDDAGIAAADINQVEFSSLVYFTGAYYSVPYADPMEFTRIDEARIQIYNFTTASWETLGGDFFTELGITIWEETAEAAMWDQTIDLNPDNPIVRTKSSWSADYVEAATGTIRVRMFMKGAFYPGADAAWMFDEVKLDVWSGGTTVTIDVTPPLNPAADLTGVLIERSPDNAAWTDISGGYVQTYTLTDTPPSPGDWYYRIRFCNGEGTPTEYSPSKVVTVP